MPSARAPQKHRHAWARAHITLNSLYIGELKSVVVNLLCSSAAIAVNLSEVFTAYKVTSRLLALKRGGAEARKGLDALQPDWSLGWARLNHLKGIQPSLVQARLL